LRLDADCQCPGDLVVGQTKIDVAKNVFFTQRHAGLPK
jgi:hypothetical protein